ncbi:MAG TPA: sulfate adenylyltransferase [Thermoplasmata archaeon]|nr:sulfate adenylyltransferase [Thermoplasmata archaeon]
MIDPYGGRLVQRELTEPARDRRDGERAQLVTVHPAIDQLYDAEKIGIGAYSPLEGFMDSETVRSVTTTGRLPNGLPWSIPIHFPVPSDSPAAASVRAGDEVGLLDAQDRLIAVLHVDEVFPLDRRAIAQATYGTEDPAHPNVADLLAGGETAWAGRVDLVHRLLPPWERAEPTPAETREEFSRRGWSRVAAYQCRNPPHTAHEYIQRLTLEREDVDGLLIHPVVGRLKKGDYRPEVILEAYDALVRHYYPANRVMMAPLTITMRYGGPKAALFLAIVRRNYGCGVYIVGRDQAGVGKYYEPYACHRIFDAFDVGVVPARYDESFFCRRCGWMASGKTCAHPVSERAETSQSRIRQALASGAPLPPEILRPEVAEILRRPNVTIV